MEELIGEIAAASGEQSQGIEQINRAVGEMDKVVQQNAANAEESASSSRELNGQAERMKTFVGDLKSLVEGSRAAEMARPKAAKEKAPRGKDRNDALHKAEKTGRKRLTGPGRSQEVKPEQLISFKDEDMSEF